MLFRGIPGLTRQARSASAAAGLAGLMLFAAGAAWAQGQTQTQTATPTGIWIDHTGRGAVEIYPCGAQICGRIAWLKDATDGKGGPAKDKQGRALCGLQIIGEVKPKSNTVWDEGWIYDPDKDDKFDVEITLKGRDQLQVMGYAGVKFLSETHVWKRASAPLGGCNAAGPS